MGESDEKEKKKPRVLEWIKAFMPIASVLLAGFFSVVVVESYREIKAQETMVRKHILEAETNRDMEIVRITVDILMHEQKELYEWLPSLVSHVSDTTLQRIMLDGVFAMQSEP